MFLKITRSKNRYYLQLVRSYRENGKVRHELIANLGGHDQLEDNPLLMSLGKRMLNISGHPVSESKPKIELEELGRYCYGDVLYRKLWEKLDIPLLIKTIIRRRRIRYDFERTLYFMTIERLLSPKSKLAGYMRQERWINIEAVELQHLYRSHRSTGRFKRSDRDLSFQQTVKPVRLES